MAEYGKLVGVGQPRPVPAENQGGPGTRDGHWRETVFANELMTGFVGGAPNPLSRLTVGSLQDLGYVVDMEAADEYALPNHLELAERSELRTHAAPVGAGTVQRTIPVILPEDSLLTPA